VTKLSSLVTPKGKNKYELAVVAAREARRLNDWTRRTGEVVPGKVPAVALERTVKGDVEYYYDEESESQ
jgi:DNA-directed RNA polymerase subunit K/omega